MLRNPEKSKQSSKKWRDENKDYNKSRQRKYQLKYNYGITEEDYNFMLQQQGGKCAICSSDKPTGKWKVFAVDHCHHTNVIRGLLCNECNRGIGLLGDDSQRLRAAANYLDKTNEERKERKKK